MNGRAHVVVKPGQGELRSPGSATDLLGGLEHEHRSPSLRQRNRSAQPVRTRADHDRIKRLPMLAHSREHTPQNELTLLKRDSPLFGRVNCYSKAVVLVMRI